MKLPSVCAWSYCTRPPLGGGVIYCPAHAGRIPRYRAIGRGPSPAPVQLQLQVRRPARK